MDTKRSQEEIEIPQLVLINRTSKLITTETSVANSGFHNNPESEFINNSFNAPSDSYFTPNRFPTNFDPKESSPPSPQSNTRPPSLLSLRENVSIVGTERSFQRQMVQTSLKEKLLSREFLMFITCGWALITMGESLMVSGDEADFPTLFSRLV
jgi:hypothetical protein